MVSKVDISYISSGCNRSPLCADWNSQNVICYGSANSVALLDPNYQGAAKITDTLTKHTGKVNAVRWIRSPSGTQNHIISGSIDCTAIIWSKTNDTFIPWKSLIGHKNSVSVVDAAYVKSNDSQPVLYAITASVDSTIKIWKQTTCDEDFSCTQTIDLGTGLCLALRILILPDINIPIIACAYDDSKIHLFVEVIDNQYEKKFSKVASLMGHEDWVRCLDLIEVDKKRVMLASCSQDTYVRLWSLEPYQEDESVNTDIRIEKKVFSIGDIKWSVCLEAVLSGHEGWVYGVHWNLNKSKVSESGDAKQCLRLLSSSLDKTLIVWEPDITDGEEGIWTEKIRLGEVGGNGLGFYGGQFNKEGNSIMGYGFMGSFHIWKHNEETNHWNPSVICGGHFAGVVDLGWEPGGQFIVSVGTDQTTRIHAPWVRDDNSNITWHELARPQVHGYDMSSLAIISKYTFASGAEEKVIRTFQAPHNFINNLHSICDTAKDDEPKLTSAMPEGASVPSLGLSNKAVYLTDPKPAEKKHVKDQYLENYFTPIDLKEPPTEETLMQNTLWPELHKLYGHGYEVYTLAASKNGKLLASACKATTAEHAAILIWDTNTWLQIQSLQSHQLTVTQLAFSPDNLSLLSVSRDRRWSVFERESLDSNDFTLAGTTDKSNGFHTRIIWCCAWTHDSKFFATGSRDGKVMVWGKTKIEKESSMGAYNAVTSPLDFSGQSVTALGFAPTHIHNKYLLATGLEAGLILIHSLQMGAVPSEWKLNQTLNNSMGHHLTVTRLCFRPSLGAAGQKKIDENILQLASASTDKAVKVFNLCLYNN